MKVQFSNLEREFKKDNFEELISILSKNRITKNFLSDPTNFKLLTNSIYSPTEKNYEKLNQAFKEYVRELQIISFFSKVIEGTKNNFYKKMNKQIEYYYHDMDQIYHPVQLLVKLPEDESAVLRPKKI